MGVLYVKPLWTGRSGVDGIQRKRTYTQCFEVRTTLATDDPTVAGGTSLLPRNGAPYPTDAFALMVNIRPESREEDPTLWTVSCDYSTEIPSRQAKESQTVNPATGASTTSPSGRDPTAREENPLDRPPVYETDYEETTEIITHTWQNTPILNCADDEYDPPIEDEVSRAVITVTKNLAVVDFDWLENFANSVNNTVWLGRAPRTCRIVGISKKPAFENNVSFWRCVFRIKVKKETWDRRVAERGYNEKSFDGINWVRQPLYSPDGSGIVPDKPFLLNGGRDPGDLDRDTDMPLALQTPIIAGVKYPTGVDGTTGRGQLLAGGSTVRYSRWRIKPEKNFALLGI